MHHFVIILCFIKMSETASESNHLRIIGGRDITEGEYPFVVILLLKILTYYFRLCTASIITHKFVLSAAHCFETAQAKNIFIWRGNFTSEPVRSQLVGVRQLIIHPRYFLSRDRGLWTGNDICLLHVEEMSGVAYGRLLAVDHLTMIGLPVKYVGGGTTDKPAADSLRPLQVGEGAIKPCGKEDGKQVQSICVMPKCSTVEHSPWRGDSGGPLVFEGKIVGVASYTRRYLPRSVFTAVSSYLDWINGELRKVE